MTPKMTKAQQQSCFRLYDQSWERSPCDSSYPIKEKFSYLSFRRRFKLCDAYRGNLDGSYFGGYVGSIFIGIERDGHAHS